VQIVYKSPCGQNRNFLRIVDLLFAPLAFLQSDMSFV
jgi:hypothetical protein